MTHITSNISLARISRMASPECKSAETIISHMLRKERILVSTNNVYYKCTEWKMNLSIALGSVYVKRKIVGSKRVLSPNLYEKLVLYSKELWTHRLFYFDQKIFCIILLDNDIQFSEK